MKEKILEMAEAGVKLGDIAEQFGIPINRVSIMLSPYRHKKIVCEYCNQRFMRRRFGMRFCSKNCKIASHIRQHGKGPQQRVGGIYACRDCGQKFKKTQRRHVLCGDCSAIITDSKIITKKV